MKAHRQPHRSYFLPRLVSAVLIGLTSASCSFQMPDLASLVPEVQPPVSATPSLTPAPTGTASPTQPTPTFTFTPTLTGQKSPTPTPRLQPTTTGGTATNVGTLTPTPQMGGLAAIELSATEIYLSGCDPRTVTFRVDVGGPPNVAFVVLFVRFKSTSGALGPWTDFTMEHVSPGKYTYELKPAEMNGYGEYRNPWIQYQVVTADKGVNVLGRTQIFDNAVTLKSGCVPTATTSPGS